MAANTTDLRHSYNYIIKYVNIAGGTTTTGANATAITKLARFTFLDSTLREVNVTHLESPNRYMEFLSANGWFETARMPVECLMAEGQYDSLLTLYHAGTEKFWEIWHPLLSGQTTNAKELFRGMIGRMGRPEISRDSDDAVMLSWDLVRTTDKFTFTQGS